MWSLLHHRHYRGIAMLLVACALAVRVLVPSGYMVTPGDTGPTIMICSGQGPMTIALPAGIAAVIGHDASKPGQGHDKAPDHPCASFAAASAAVDLASTLHPAPPVTIATFTLPMFHAFVRPGLGLAAPPPPKTGPPSLA